MASGRRHVGLWFSVVGYVLAARTRDQGTRDQGTRDQGTRDQGTRDQGTRVGGPVAAGHVTSIVWIADPQLSRLMDFRDNVLKVAYV